MLKIQTYLLNHTFAELASEHSVACHFADDGIKFSLNYDILAKEDDEISNECRGLILIPADKRKLATRAQHKSAYDNICPGETSIVAFGFRRFFNNGQGLSPID